ncbi:unnamed protein product, partial [Mesorhabditis belari]|uniref:Uncharacterized protein n=1 Tax=Mesorhabditis belari TaxID=2138241 RepID=A0AAF3FDP5_9BILA
MPISEDDLRAKLQTLNPEHLEVTDESDGCGAKFQLVIVSEVFKGKTTLASHRLVQDSIKEEMPQIHAVSIKTFTPEKWTAQKNA